MAPAPAARALLLAGFCFAAACHGAGHPPQMPESLRSPHHHHHPPLPAPRPAGHGSIDRVAPLDTSPPDASQVVRYFEQYITFVEAENMTTVKGSWEPRAW